MNSMEIRLLATVIGDGEGASMIVNVEYDFDGGSPMAAPTLTFPGEPEEPPELTVNHVWLTDEKGNVSLDICRVIPGDLLERIEAHIWENHDFSHVEPEDLGIYVHE